MSRAHLVDLEVGALDSWELLASGSERKLERFGELLIDRPAPQAIWPSEVPFPEATAVFQRNKDGSGKWTTRAKSANAARVSLMGLVFEIRLTGFGNVGLFPEHAAHWQWMIDRLLGRPDASVLNLFAYTGGASMACARAGAGVTHVDAARSANAWAEVNAGLSGISGGSIRYLTDDVMKLVRREQRRGNRYLGIIIDPPSFGRGPKGETWKIERDLAPLLDACFPLLDEQALFVLLTSHSPGVTPAVLRALLLALGGTVQSGEMLLKGPKRSLPQGAYARWTP